MVEMNMPLTLQVYFSPTQAEEFLRSISGDGGGQHFVRKCQDRLRGQNGLRTDESTLARNVMLTLHGDDVEKWFRYRNDYGSGGFQSRLGRAPKQESII